MLYTKVSRLKEGDRSGTFQHSQASSYWGVRKDAFEASHISIA